MDKYKKLASNTIVLALGQLGSKLLVYVMMRFYTGQLGSYGYGAVANIVNASTLLIAVVTLSIGESIIRFGLDKSCDKTQVFSVGVKTTLTGLIVFLPFVPLIGKIDFLSDYAFLIYLYVFTGSIKSTCALFVRSIGHVRLYAVDGIITTFANIAFNLLFLAVFDMGILGYVLSVVLADFISIVFLTVSAGLKRYFNIFAANRSISTAMFRYCIPLIPTSIMWWITSVSDTFFISGMIDKSATGVYAAAYKFPNIVMLVSGIFSQAWNMSAITEKNSRKIAKFYSDVFNFFQSIVYVISASILLIIRPLLSFMVVGEGFSDAPYRHTPILLLAVVFTCFSTFMGSIYVASKKSVLALTTTSIGALINLILNALLIPFMGIDGAALATLISYLVIFCTRAINTRPLVFMNLRLVKMITNIIVLSAMGAVVMFVLDEFTYYIALSSLFLIIIIINFHTGTSALNYVLDRMVKKRNNN